MVPTINLERNLRPFEKVCEHFYILAPNRFMVMPAKRRGVMKSKKRVGWKYDEIGHCVIGTLNDRFDTSGKFSMDELTIGRLMRACGAEPNEFESLPISKIPDVNLLRNRDAAVRFELKAENVGSLKKVARLFQSVRRKKSKSKLYLGITTGNQSICLQMCDGQGVASFRQTPSADVILPFSGSISAETLKSLRSEDYAVTIDVNGVVEMIGVESGLVFLIPTTEI